MNKRKILYWSKEYFTFSSSERNGIVTLISLIVITLTAIFLLPSFIKEQPQIDVSQFENEIAKFEKECDSIAAQSPLISRFQDTTKHFKPTTAKRSQTHKLELNMADSAELASLQGIGPVFAKRIVKYRNSLGGFYSISQLGEVYGIAPETLIKITHNLIVDTLKIERLLINSADFKKVNAHPYISFDQTKQIFNLRSRQKLIVTDQLIENKIFTSEEIKKLLPYLSFY